MLNHILVVDDDAALRNYIGLQLQRFNHRVSSAGSGESALEMARHERPDLIILDHYLPDMTGEEVLGALRVDETMRPIPVIFLTIDGSQARFRALMNAGADDFLAKPVKPQELADAVSAQLRKSQLRSGRHQVLPELPGLPDGYELLGTLGTGGTATAYLARHAEREAQRVIKTMRLGDDPDLAVLDRFAREGTLLERLAHPNIVRVYDHGVREGYAYLVMEYLAGGSLKQMIGHAWTPEDALGLLAKVADALGVVHAAGIVHRDIKPDNIMLRDASLEPVLVDFGAAKDLTGPQQAVTQNAVILGTPNYMAPEVIRGEACVPASDVYACGVMLYELLTGAKPYVAGNATALLHQHLEYPIPLLPSRLAKYKPLLDALLAKKAADRPADGTALLQYLLCFI
jgi:DNA-binding response OmpR family regulator